MPERFDLGGAAYHLVIDKSQFGPVLKQAEAEARAASAKIDAALRGGVIAPRVNAAPATAGLGEIATQAKVAKAAAEFTATPKVNAQPAQTALSGLGAGLKGVVALGAGVAGVAIGVEAIGQALTGSIAATREAQQATLALNATYGSGASQFIAFADAQAQALGKSNVEFKQAAVTAATLTRNYGLTAEQIQTVIQRSTDLATVQGIGIVDATNRVTSALRGEAEAAELLGLTLNSDAIKAIADMTSEQRKNFETLDILTKSQITYREFLRQTAHAEGIAAKAAADGVTAYDQAGAAFNRLGVEAGNSIDPIGKGLAGAFRDAADGVAEFIRQQRQLPGYAQRATALTPIVRGGADDDPEARRVAQLEALRKERAKEASTKAQIDRSEATRLAALARESQAEITRSALEDISERRQAEADAAREKREEIIETRDRDIEASRASMEAELAGLDRVAQDRARARTQEDRERSAAQETELRGLEQVHEATLKQLDDEANAVQRTRDERVRDIDAEIRAVDQKRDAALKAIDEETRAESRRHSDALRNIDIERDRKLGIIDQQLKAIDEAAQQDQRRQTDQSLARSLSDARRALRDAETPEERRRAQRAISDAEAAIQRERVNRLREDERARLRAAADEIRLAADTAKKVEDARNQAATEGLSARQRLANDQAKADTERLNAVKARVEAETKIELDSIKVRVDAERIAYEQTVQDARDAHQAINNAVADRRADEDAEFAARRVSVQKFYAAEQADIKAVSDTHLRELEQRTRNTITALDQEKRAWDDWSRSVQKSITDAMTAGDPSRLEQFRSTFGPFDPPGYRESVTSTPSSGGSAGGGFAAYTGQKFGHNDVDHYLTSKGYISGTPAYYELFDRMFELQGKGYAPPPDMIVTGRQFGGTLRPYEWSWVGEGGKPELIRAGRDGATVKSFSDSMAMVAATGQARGAYQRPEVFAPDQSGWLAGAARTAAMMNSRAEFTSQAAMWGGSGGGVTIHGPLIGSATIREEADIERLADTLAETIDQRHRAELHQALGQGTRFPSGVSRNA